jgi:hypothetical protein
MRRFWLWRRIQTGRPPVFPRTLVSSGIRRRRSGRRM